MDSIVSLTFERADVAPWIFAGLILLAGLNVPFSIDVILITAGALTSSFYPERAYWIFGLLFIACWVAAWEAYWIGRLLGPKLYHIKWFSWILTKPRIEKLHHYYEKFGIFTFLIGRFIPGGVRNALFMTSGLGKMPFLKFIFRDILGCFLSAGMLFYIGFAFGQNFETILAYVKKVDKIAVFIIIGIILVILFVAWYRSRKQTNTKDSG